MQGALSVILKPKTCVPTLSSTIWWEKEGCRGIADPAVADPVGEEGVPVCRPDTGAGVVVRVFRTYLSWKGPRDDRLWFWEHPVGFPEHRRFSHFGEDSSSVRSNGNPVRIGFIP